MNNRDKACFQSALHFVAQIAIIPLSTLLDKNSLKFKMIDSNVVNDEASIKWTSTTVESTAHVHEMAFNTVLERWYK